MRNGPLVTEKKKKTKWWVALGVTVTILAGASLGALSAYNWSVDAAINGLFGGLINQEESPEVIDDPSVDESETDSGQVSQNPEPDLPEENTDTPSEGTVTPDTEIPAEPQEPEKTPETVTEPYYVDGVLIANKQHPLPTDFAPGEDPEARTAFNQMAEAASAEGITLVAFSTFRSYDYQVDLYNRYVDQHGQEEADRFSARPGYSEHQTGLGFDIGEAGQEEHWAEDSFKDTAGAKWLAENAHEYGFILRYPAGKEEITGYQYESWHFRYLGKELATEVYNSGLTLEEYLGI
ncbi:D-alanyl-D-alanine carboxypeptidase family protein [Jeotgalibacillus sp. R-1-5s-1]|uniref:M15 family metallopeptidase n=1 Tax=Jeotgalibacillus sp. R-1-5s-1 TaxID=2555897 RepID=UPI00106D37E8|nr:M15 family metallopeptidase [Jeotgalibacillus sp. R-1-5s-1]TFD98314.1 D-alanyl-D-alanine carboxypeptidase [Jeotgalibacillus sp. R-1-5s-1]